MSSTPGPTPSSSANTPQGASHASTSIEASIPQPVNPPSNIRVLHSSALRMRMSVLRYSVNHVTPSPSSSGSVGQTRRLARLGLRARPSSRRTCNKPKYRLSAFSSTITSTDLLQAKSRKPCNSREFRANKESTRPSPRLRTASGRLARSITSTDRLQGVGRNSFRGSIRG